MFTLSVTQSVCLYSEQPTVLLARRHLNTMILTTSENSNSISNIFQESHDLLVLTVSIIICIYLRTTDRHFLDQGNVRHPSSKLLKCDVVQTLNTLRNPSLQIFAARKVSFCLRMIQFSTNIMICKLIEENEFSCCNTLECE